MDGSVGPSHLTVNGTLFLVNCHVVERSGECLVGQRHACKRSVALRRGGEWPIFPCIRSALVALVRARKKTKRAVQCSACRHGKRSRAGQGTRSPRLLRAISIAHRWGVCRCKCRRERDERAPAGRRRRRHALVSGGDATYATQHNSATHTHWKWMNGTGRGGTAPALALTKTCADAGAVVLPLAAKRSEAPSPRGLIFNSNTRWQKRSRVEKNIPL